MSLRAGEAVTQYEMAFDLTPLIPEMAMEERSRWNNNEKVSLIANKAHLRAREASIEVFSHFANASRRLKNKELASILSFDTTPARGLHFRL